MVKRYIFPNQTLRDKKNENINGNINFYEIDKQAKAGGFLFLLPLIFRGLAAAGAVAGGASGIAVAVNKKKTEEAQAKEQRRHNLEMERQAKGSGIKDLISVAKKFNHETKKTVIEGLSKLIDQIDTGEMEVEGNGLMLSNIHTGKGIFLSFPKLKAMGLS